MDFRRKLSRLNGVGVGGPASRAVASQPTGDTTTDVERQARIDALRARMQELSQGHARRRKERTSLVKPSSVGLPTQEHVTQHGTLHRRVQEHPLGHYHGMAPLDAYLRLVPDDLRKLALDASLGDVDLREIVFFDTETTGLAGGAGTLPFLIGLAYCEGDTFKVEQLFLHELGNEAPMLAHLAERLSRASCLVSFNGKSFDWPLLRTRFVMNRLSVPEVPRHVDLLHCLRRVYKFRLSELRLTRLEREVLGFAREDDISGEEIPASYFAYLRGAPPARMAKVFEHNAHDLVSLAALLGFAGERFVAAPLAPHRTDDPRDHLGFAHVAARAGDHARAQAFALAAVQADRKGVATKEAQVLLAGLAKRRGDYAQAAASLEEALVEARPVEASAIHLALAKLYEHKLRDYARALAHAEHTALKEGAEKNAARVARLTARLESCAREVS